MIGQFLAAYDLRLYCRTGLSKSANHTVKNCITFSVGEFVYAITAAEGIILSSLFIGRKQR